MAKLFSAVAMLLLSGSAEAHLTGKELAARREHRLAVEQVFRGCLTAPALYEKCLADSRKFSAERLATLPIPPYHTHTGKHTGKQKGY